MTPVTTAVSGPRTPSVRTLLPPDQVRPALISAVRKLDPRALLR